MASTIDINYYLTYTLTFFTSHFPDFIMFTKTAIGYIVGLSIVVSIMLIIGIVYAVEKLKQIRTREAETYDAKVDMGYGEIEKSHPELANKWEKVKTHIESENENDWRQAIIEADIILGDLLTKMGYRGEGIGEQLKRIEKADFESIDQAWEAHKARNMIAHEGLSSPLTKSEAKKIIDLYRKVFEEFFY